jgi:hypothetical protein
MKKLFAGYSCILFLQSFSHASVNQVTNPDKAAGQKVLIKAIAIIVNTEANKKGPAKVVRVFSSGDTSI